MDAIDLPFGLWTLVGWKNHKFDHIREVTPMCTWEGSLAPPGNYDWTVHLRRRCCFMSNYSDHWFPQPIDGFWCILVMDYHT